jgi:hypothetical protein
MTLSIRARLTLWYSSVVVAILVTGAVVGSLAQSRLGLQQLDDDLVRAMATLEGVMRTEFGERLTLEGAAAEASSEVVVPDRILALGRPDGSILEVWGLPANRAALPALAANIGVATVATPAGELRVLRRAVDYQGHQYIAAVMAPLDPLHAQRSLMVRAMSLAVAMALVAAALGGRGWPNRPGASTSGIPGNVWWLRRLTTSWGSWRSRSTDCSIGLLRR